MSILSKQLSYLNQNRTKEGFASFERYIHEIAEDKGIDTATFVSESVKREIEEILHRKNNARFHTHNGHNRTQSAFMNRVSEQD